MSLFKTVNETNNISGRYNNSQIVARSERLMRKPKKQRHKRGGYGRRDCAGLPTLNVTDNSDRGGTELAAH